MLANDGQLGAVHALWALQGLGALDEATHKAALFAKDARLRRNAVRALGTDTKSQALYFGSGIVADPDLTTRLAALVKLAEFDTTENIQTLVKRLGSDKISQNDEWLKEATVLLAKKHHAGAGKFKEAPTCFRTQASKSPEPTAFRKAGSAATTTTRPPLRVRSGRS